jgi:hypothetical protein
MEPGAGGVLSTARLRLSVEPRPHRVTVNSRHGSCACLNGLAGIPRGSAVAFTPVPTAGNRAADSLIVLVVG